MSESCGEDRLAHALGETIGRLAHDLKNPLAVVLSNLRFIEGQLADLDLREAAMESAISAERIARMIDDVAALEPLARGSYSTEQSSRPLDSIKAALDQAILPQLGSRQLLIDLPAGRVVTDFSLLERIAIAVLEHGLRRTTSRGTLRVAGECNERGFVLRFTDEGAPFSAGRTPSFLALQLPEVEPPLDGCRSDQGLGLFFAGAAARFLGARCSIVPLAPGPGMVFELVFDSQVAGDSQVVGV